MLNEQEILNLENKRKAVRISRLKREIAILTSDRAAAWFSRNWHGTKSIAEAIAYCQNKLNSIY